MSHSSAQATRKLIEENCAFLERFPADYKYLRLPEELRVGTEMTVAQVRAKLKADQLQLALVGGFSAGKSTLINAMLDDVLLASRASPTTICPTYISFGSSKEIAINLKTLPRRTDIIDSPLPKAVWIKGKFIPGGSAQMSTASGVEYMLTQEFGHRGLHRYTVFLDELPVVSRSIYVPKPKMQVAIMYNLLTNTTATSLECSAIPDAKLPTVRYSSAPDGAAATLRSIWLDMRWEAVVRVCADSGKVCLGFDSDWFDSTRPVHYVERRMPSVIQRLRALFQPSYRYKRVASNSSRCPRSACANSSGRGATNFLVRLNLLNNTFTVDELGQTPFVTRVLRLPDDSSHAAKALAALTAAARTGSGEKDYSDVIHSVAVHYPSELLRRRLILIDTPGIAADSIHTMKTIEVMEREADACLFLLPAEQAGTLSDLDFVKNHVMSSVGDIIFVLTKADKADSSEELNELIDNVKNKVRAKLGLSNCMVLAVSAKEALAGRDPEARARFRGFVDEVSSFAERNRDLIMVRRLLGAEAAVMHRLKEAADSARAEYESERARLQSYAIENLKSFIERERKGVFRRFDTAFDSERYGPRVERALIGVIRRAQSEVGRMISEAEDMQRLKEVCESGLRYCVDNMNAALSIEYRNQLKGLEEPMQQLVRTVFADFERSFEKQYPLTRLTGRRISIDVRQNLRGLSNADVQEQVAAVAEAISNERSAGGTGATIGAIVGTILLPGVGSVVGGVLGYFASKLFGPSLADVKASVARDVDSKLDHLMSNVIPSCVADSMTGLRNDLLGTLESGIGDYIREYTKTVNRLIAEHAQKKQEVDAFIQKSRSIAEDLDRRVSELETLKASLCAE